MVYKFTHNDVVLEFAKNRGRAYLEASEPSEAIERVRGLFGSMRDPEAQSLGSGQYLVSFGILLDYRLGLVRQVAKAVKMLRDEHIYSSARYIDRYMAATVCHETGKPEWLLTRGGDIQEEIDSLRKAAVVAREVGNISDFVDWDIAIYNYIELNSKEGHHSRVVRNVSKEPGD